MNIHIPFYGIFVDGNALLYSSLGQKINLQLALTNATAALRFDNSITWTNKIKGLRPLFFLFFN